MNGNFVDFFDPMARVEMTMTPTNVPSPRSGTSPKFEFDRWPGSYPSLKATLSQSSGRAPTPLSVSFQDKSLPSVSGKLVVGRGLESPFLELDMPMTATSRSFSSPRSLYSAGSISDEDVSHSPLLSDLNLRHSPDSVNGYLRDNMDRDGDALGEEESLNHPVSWDKDPYITAIKTLGFASPAPLSQYEMEYPFGDIDIYSRAGVGYVAPATSIEIASLPVTPQSDRMLIDCLNEYYLEDEFSNPSQPIPNMSVYMHQQELKDDAGTP